jgi:uncharacterized protein YegP (UPF0339 family)
MVGEFRELAERSRGGGETTGGANGGVRFEIRRSRDGFYWRIVSEADEHVLAASESYTCKSRCHRDLATVLLGIGKAAVTDLS